MTYNFPLVTVNILSFNRKEELRNTLTKVYEQDYTNIEVIVVDNASLDGSPDMVEKEFPNVILIKMSKNIGIAGWNEGFKIAKGEYVLVLDDDSYPDTQLLTSVFQSNKEYDKIGVISFNIYNKKKDRIHLIQTLPRTICFIGCGALLNTSLINEIGGFNQFLFLYEHEIEFSMRVIDYGFDILLFEHGIIFHNEADTNRKTVKKVDKRRIYYNLRNALMILYLHFNLKYVVFHSIRIVLIGLLHSIINFSLITALKAIIDFVKFASNNFENRSELKLETQIIYQLGGYAGGFFHLKSSKPSPPNNYSPIK